MKLRQVDFEQYAKLIVFTGANVQKGQKVQLTVATDQQQLARAITEQCYKAGASLVEVIWECGEIEKLHYTHAAVDTLGTVLEWQEARAKQMTKDLPVRIFIESADPDEMDGISPDVLSTVGQMRRKVLKKYRDEIDGRHQWVIAAAASEKWAKKVFPTDDAEVAVAKLWDAILACVYFDDDVDLVDVWAKHIADLERRAKWLNAQKFVTLKYKSSNGTDFTVGLNPAVRWGAANDKNQVNGTMFVPNMPTEELFTTPMRGVAEGRLVSTKPLNWSGQLIDRFTVDFKDGKVVGCSAEQGEELLKKMFAMDEGASMLGEVALVPKESPINRSGLLFYNTLFDENACCHVAVGEGFAELLDGFMDMSREERKQKGINDSMIHVDFMIGCDDLEITGILADGTCVPIFTNGTWAENVG